MKKPLVVLLTFIMAALVLTACGPNQEEIQKEFMNILDKPASEENIQQAAEYLDKYLPKMEAEYASHMVVGYESYILEFNQNGIEYKDWIGKYEKYVNKELIGLYEIKLKEQKKPMIKDGNLNISYKELLKRTYDMETYIQKNKKEHLIKEDATWMYENYINALIMGTNGTPVFDYKTKAFSKEAKAEYAGFINKNPDLTTAWVLTEYFTYLESIEYTMNYEDKISSKLFFDTCDWLVSESGKRVFQ